MMRHLAGIAALLVLAACASASADVLIGADGKEMTVTVVTQNETGVVVKDGDAEKTIPYDELEARCAYGYLKKTVKEDDAESWLALGKYCLKRDLKAEGMVALITAKKLKPELANEVNKVWAEHAAAPRPVLTPEQTKAVVAQQLARAEVVEKAIGAKVDTLETDHFVIHTTLVKSDHRILQKRCEQLYDGFDSIFQIGKEGDRMWDGKCVMYLFVNRQQFIDFSTKVDNYPGQLAGGYFRAQGGECEVVIPVLKDKETFLETMVHEGAHAFLHFYRTPGRIPTWVHEGVAQHFQFENFPKSNMRSLMVRIVDSGIKSGQTLRLEELAASPRPATGADQAAYAYAYSYIGFLIHKSPKDFAAFVRGLKENKDANASLKESYGWDLKEMEKNWYRSVARR